MLEVDLRQGHESSPGSTPPSRYQRLTRRSGSIKNLISFYEATYSTKARFQKNNSIDPAYQRQVSSPPLSHRKLMANFLPVSSISSSPGFSPSPSSSSASSTERLSYYTNSFSIDSERSCDKKECNQGTNNKELQSPSLLWSLSTTSSSSGFSSGFSSPSQPHPPADVIFANHDEIRELPKDTKQLKSKPRLPTSKSLFTIKQANSKTKTTTLNVAEPSAKKTNSFTDISQRALSNLRLMKKNPPSLTKLLERSKSFAKSKSNNKLKIDDLALEATTSDQQEILLQRERPTDLTVFKSIRKVLHTVKLCKLEKFPTIVQPPLKHEQSSTSTESVPEVTSLGSEATTESQSAKLDKPLLDADSPKENESVIITEPAVVVPTTTENISLKLDEIKAARPAPPKTVNKSISMVEALTEDLPYLKPENRINKSTFASKSFNKKEPTVTPSKSTIGGLAPRPTWSATMSTSYSFSKLSRSQSQRFPSSSGANQRRYDPKNTQKIVLDWCQHSTRNYDNVQISNFSSSWSDGLAFCALIHSFVPDAFEYKKLSAANRRQNFELAFETAYKKAGIMPLLEVNDMLNMGNRPDDRCVFTYVSTIYTRFQSAKQKLAKTISEPATKNSD